MPARNDDIGINIVSEFKDSTLNDGFHYSKNSRGSEMTPWIAEAASVAGLDR
jgi:hypothetical protein